MAEIVKEIKFFVLSAKDIGKYLSSDDMLELARISHKIDDGRKKDGKKNNHYITCNEDEPYADKVWQIILNGEKEKAENLKKGNQGE